MCVENLMVGLHLHLLIQRSNVSGTIVQHISNKPSPAVRALSCVTRTPSCTSFLLLKVEN